MSPWIRQVKNDVIINDDKQQIYFNKPSLEIGARTTETSPNKSK